VTETDLVIIGGGPSGISTALHVHAANPRIRQVVLEARAYPREKICAGGIGARAFRKLERLGVTLECPMVNLNAIALKFGDETIVMRDEDLGVVVRRVEFDHAFAKAAIARGIDVRDSTPVSHIAIEDDHVRVETETGDVFRAKAIVGADGVGGITRRLAGFAAHALRAQVVELDTESLPTDVPRDTILFDFTARDLRGYAWDFPTVVANQPLVCRGAYVIHTPGARSGSAGPRSAAEGRRDESTDTPKRRIEQYLISRGLDLSRYKLKQYAERGFEPGSEIARPRVLLVGEAAGIDIATGEGIAQAIEYGYVAGPYLAKAFARDDWGFGGWRTHLEGRHLGWQLRVRHLYYEVFYGHRREQVERLLPQMRSVISIAVQDFAGKKLSKLDMVRGAAQFLTAMAREKMRADA
jgi:flavin-dependent dehydrogenase